MTVSAAQLMVTIGGNAAGAQAAITSTAAMLGKTGMLGMAAVGAGAIMVATGAIATKMAGDFQAGITSLATGAGESTSNLKMVSAGILQMAKDTGTSTKQLVDGMYMIESGGFHGAAGLKILKAAAEGAKVGNADLGVVADSVDTILKNFGEHGALSATQATNALITTVANGKTHLEDLAESLAFVLPAGAAAGLGLKDVLGAMATMTSVGVPAAESATYLRQMIIALEAPSAGARGELAKIGITTQELGAAMKKGLPDALQLIQDQLAKHGIKQGTAEYVAALREISGGTRQMQGMLNLMGPHLKTFKDDVGKIGGAASATGTQVKGWDLVQKTFNQQLSRAGEVVQTLMISLGQKLLPVATQFVAWLANNALPAIKNFASFISGSSTQAQILRPILLAVAIAIGGALVASFIAWAAAAASAAVATIAATWPILAIGAAIALVAAGFLWAYNNIKPVHDLVDRIRLTFGLAFQVLGTTVLPALGAFIARMGGIGNVLKILGLFALGPIGLLILLVTHLSQVRDALGTAAGAIGRFFGNLFGTIGSFVGKWIGYWVTLQQQTIKHVLQLAGDLLAHIGKMKDNLIARIELFIITTIAKFLYLKQQAIKHAVALATGFMDALKNLPGKLLALGEQLIQNLAQGIRNAAGNVTSALKSIPGLGGVVGGIQSVIPHFAAGGVMGTGGMALVGEQGPELVYLPSGARVSPNAGGAGSAGVGGGQPIVVNLMVDGRKLAAAIVPHQGAAVRALTGQRSF